MLDLNEALRDFSDPLVLFIASLFVLSEVLNAAGITAGIGLPLALVFLAVALLYVPLIWPF
ncbi:MULTISPECIES: hypothetical protein [unclassified Microbacterium]|uniref:hypothetical protein n=1 Tax=unclassified Microbacterium TaxID=2609290 RepID=UPI00214B8362|nr:MULTISPECIES: hypothetical protein [unclassified Microbacterium]MCR2809092.1 hypothetical protein [Microbacterium sp. zg.B185]WIM20247.1 hypothetical protein QNO12_05435 [Microbacterium sp. zg-B185]